MSHGVQYTGRIHKVRNGNWKVGYLWTGRYWSKSPSDDAADPVIFENLTPAEPRRLSELPQGR